MRLFPSTNSPIPDALPPKRPAQKDAAPPSPHTRFTHRGIDRETRQVVEGPLRTARVSRKANR